MAITMNWNRSIEGIGLQLTSASEHIFLWRYSVQSSCRCSCRRV